ILLPYLLALLAEAESVAGSRAAALNTLTEAESVADAIGARLFLPGLLLRRGRLLRGREGLDVLARARQLAVAQGAVALAAVIEKAAHRRGYKFGAETQHSPADQ
ncbi:MAG: hypothetical protein ACREF3_13595, partial [Acetobacteraceae bacterium]